MGSISDSDEWCLSRVQDAIALSRKRGRPCFVGFLDEHQRAVTEPVLRKSEQGYAYFGGYAEAQRTFLAVYPSDFPAEAVRFPCVPLGFAYRAEAALTHRDFLGTLLACGVERDVIGDILCGDGRSVVFVAEEMLPFLQSQITRVGGEGVRLIPYDEGELPAAYRLVDVRETVASARLDCVVAALKRCSRSQAADCITAGLVSVDHIVCTSVSREVLGGQTISIRGAGRFRIDAVEAVTKKGRLVLEAKQYQ